MMLMTNENIGMN